MGTVVSFDIDGTLEIGDPPGIITIASVRAARQLGYVVGSCSDRPLAHQRQLWQRLALDPDFTVLKHRLAEVRLPSRRSRTITSATPTSTSISRGWRASASCAPTPPRSRPGAPRYSAPAATRRTYP